MENIPSFIKQIDGEYAVLPLKYANSILGNKQNVYDLTLEEGWELPDFACRAISIKYLLKVLDGKVFRIQRSQVNRYSIIKERWSKLDLMRWIEERLPQGTELGFAPESLPDYRWLLNISFTIDPNMPVFSGIQAEEKMVKIPYR